MIGVPELHANVATQALVHLQSVSQFFTTSTELCAWVVCMKRGGDVAGR